MSSLFNTRTSTMVATMTYGKAYANVDVSPLADKLCHVQFINHPLFSSLVFQDPEVERQHVMIKNEWSSAAKVLPLHWYGLRDATLLDILNCRMETK